MCLRGNLQPFIMNQHQFTPIFLLKSNTYHSENQTPVKADLLGETDQILSPATNTHWNKIKKNSAEIAKSIMSCL